jgi:hypothetical protein
VTDRESSSWRDVARWFWDVFGPFIKSGIGPALGSGGVVIVAGRKFVTTSHEVPGWIIVVAAGIAGLCVVSVGLHVTGFDADGAGDSYSSTRAGRSASTGARVPARTRP